MFTKATIKPSPEPFEPDPELRYSSKYYIPIMCQIPERVISHLPMQAKRPSRSILTNMIAVTKIAKFSCP